MRVFEVEPRVVKYQGEPSFRFFVGTRECRTVSGFTYPTLIRESLKLRDIHGKREETPDKQL
jgi:hypothetical protein